MVFNGYSSLRQLYFNSKRIYLAICDLYLRIPNLIFRRQMRPSIAAPQFPCAIYKELECCVIFNSIGFLIFLVYFSINPRPHLVHLLYSPNNRRTRLSTLSFSGSYGWSLLGISNTAGNASEKESTVFRMRSAICFPFQNIVCKAERWDCRGY